jgi:hypothetical protein
VGCWVKFHSGGMVPGTGEVNATLLGGERVQSREELYGLVKTKRWFTSYMEVEARSVMHASLGHHGHASVERVNFCVPPSLCRLPQRLRRLLAEGCSWISVGVPAGEGLLNRAELATRSVKTPRRHRPCPRSIFFGDLSKYLVTGDKPHRTGRLR